MLRLMLMMIFPFVAKSNNPHDDLEVGSKSISRVVRGFGWGMRGIWSHFCIDFSVCIEYLKRSMMIDLCECVETLCEFDVEGRSLFSIEVWFMFMDIFSGS